MAYVRLVRCSGLVQGVANWTGCWHVFQLVKMNSNVVILIGVWIDVSWGYELIKTKGTQSCRSSCPFLVEESVSRVSARLAEAGCTLVSCVCKDTYACK